VLVGGPAAAIHASHRFTSAVLQLAKQLAEPKPGDLGDGDLRVYRLLSDNWNDWKTVFRAAKRFAVALLDAYERAQ
jgi:hypothetical protein